ncbi:bifunctional proline dehydrogenase/L-glutamate gamma-semialdehyde dehydrogenase PutA [Motiliproteus sediminis]|uniref:bifunctional proline dehydrogenase/L-glutamate gamma-semialdehyde dehydrogenase PutA n=1 Tax=Motiliproteus sediminis TaxID=1468178 RepID=UPI001AEFBE1F|nr:bifunctional proline dehydrogenase/L-glutamate gamma-semialdehyde dehydrogenase PutA [Motiliproteus sediminis]
MFKASDVLKGDFLNQDLSAIEQLITQNYAVDEDAYLRELLPLATPSESELQQITDCATRQVETVRANDKALHNIDKLLQEYSLDTEEGVILMCLAEALMRIPDADTADALIRNKLAGADWKRHMGNSESLLVNASTWGLMLTGKIVSLDKDMDGNPNHLLKRLVNRAGEPVIRKAMYQAMKIMGKQFVLGRKIDEAVTNGGDCRKKGYTYSYDMLGEAAFTMADADRYFRDYLQAIEKVGGASNIESRSGKPTISIKLSALHPRYEVANRDRVLTELVERVIELVRTARKLDVGITIDAEEADRLELSLDLFKAVYNSAAAKGWGKLGLVVQAYQKRALPVLCWLTKLAAEQGDPIPVRLVKGAYWDSEIKHSQQFGLNGYPVYTRKEGTDCAYLACARFLLSDLTVGRIEPQFATHNAHTVAAIMTMANSDRYEFQRLHGMGDALYDAVLADQSTRCRIYAPVGAHKDLLPYLVRRLLENGANSSFVHRLVDARTPVADLVHHPVQQLLAFDSLSNDRIPLPSQILGSDRINSEGINMNINAEQQTLMSAIRQFDQRNWAAGPIINGATVASAAKQDVFSPFDQRQKVGTIGWANAELAGQALDIAAAAFTRWNDTDAEVRAQTLEKMADLMEQHRAELMALCTREAGKSLQDGIDEVREAVDFCRYYANQARARFGSVIELPGPTGESNELYLEGRGVFLCISPWNFPLAIFIGQVVAALAAGNTVIAKPAEQTGLIAHRAIELLLEAGVPAGAIQLLPGKGAEIGGALTSDPRIAGVAFTGSTETAQLINKTLAGRNGPIATFVAETGGQNAMLVDSTALPEQVVNDVVHSSFTSAGQRCSALRVLYVQEDVADRIVELIKGAMQELTIGNPEAYKTDVGPVIDADAKAKLNAHIEQMRDSAKFVYQCELPAECGNGHFVAPTAFEIGSMNELAREQFGPILHIVRFKASELDAVIDEINASGYGLTLGIHSRNEGTAAYIDSRVRVGNVYVNRNQIGAVVGVQPFGGMGLSGTGPKAGGPHYLLRFATERTRTINTTAVGGNATLLSLGDKAEEEVA